MIQQINIKTKLRKFSNRTPIKTCWSFLQNVGHNDSNLTDVEN